MPDMSIKPFIEFVPPKIKLSSGDKSKLEEQIARMMGKIYCSICKLYFYDLSLHCKETGDGDHLVLLVHNA